MASKFYNDITADERKDWRQHSTTVLALEMLREFQEEAARDALHGPVLRTHAEMADDIGFHRGIQECIELLERE